MAQRKLYIYKNNKSLSQNAYDALLKKAAEKGFEVVEDPERGVDLIACIGGDGTFLSCIHRLQFPAAPVLGINTGHLGFFQEANPDEIEDMLQAFIDGELTEQIINPVEATIVTDSNEYKRIGINEVLVRGQYSEVSHFEVSIDDTKIQDFSGDGLLISTPVGSTAYNYSLGGSLVAPNLDILQLTPVAPMNTNAYRCFHSSILFPADEVITLKVIGKTKKNGIILSFDGKTHEFGDVEKVTLRRSDKVIRLLRAGHYDYWQKLTSKLL